MKNNFNWFAVCIGIVSIISACISTARYIEWILMTGKHRTMSLIAAPALILFLMGLGYILLRIGINGYHKRE